LKHGKLFAIHRIPDKQITFSREKRLLFSACLSKLAAENDFPHEERFSRLAEGLQLRPESFRHEAEGFRHRVERLRQEAEGFRLRAESLRHRGESFPEERESLPEEVFFAEYREKCRLTKD
jgi:hypothetical protein